MKNDFHIKKQKIDKMFENVEDNINIKGLDNIFNDEATIYVGNHTCILDVFLISKMVSFPLISVVSATTFFGKYSDRKAVFDEILYPFPMEVRGGRKYVDLCMDGIEELLETGFSFIYFAQGVFDDGNSIGRARTGLSRIIFHCMENNIPIKIAPVALKMYDINLDNYLSTEAWDSFHADISFLPSFDCSSYYSRYLDCKDWKERNKILHDLVDDIMLVIANELSLPLLDYCVPLYDMGTFLSPAGKEIKLEDADDPELYRQYENSVKKLVKEYKQMK